MCMAMMRAFELYWKHWRPARIFILFNKWCASSRGRKGDHHQELIMGFRVQKCTPSNIPKWCFQIMCFAILCFVHLDSCRWWFNLSNIYIHTILFQTVGEKHTSFLCSGSTRCARTGKPDEKSDICSDDSENIVIHGNLKVTNPSGYNLGCSLYEPSCQCVTVAGRATIPRAYIQKINHETGWWLKVWWHSFPRMVYVS